LFIERENLGMNFRPRESTIRWSVVRVLLNVSSRVKREEFSRARFFRRGLIVGCGLRVRMEGCCLSELFSWVKEGMRMESGVWLNV
jgi:hypothetical protein